MSGQRTFRLARLREHRQRAELRQGNLAARAGVSMSGPSCYELGYRTVAGKVVEQRAKLGTARRLAHALGVKPCDLVSFNDREQAVRDGWGS